MTKHFGGLTVSHWSLIAAIGIACCPSLTIARDGAGKTEERQGKHRELATDATAQDNAGQPPISNDPSSAIGVQVSQLTLSPPGSLESVQTLSRPL